jgi:predicted acylesterase/phospholipase RssA
MVTAEAERIDHHVWRDHVEGAAEQLVGALTSLYGIHDPEALRQLVDAARWLRVTSGHVVHPAEDDPPWVLMVVLGHLRVSHANGQGARALIEHVARGRLIRQPVSPQVTVAATRDTLLAGFPPDQLHRLAVAVPELLMPSLTAFPDEQDRQRRHATVLGVVVAPDLDRRFVSSRLASALGTVGRTELLWPERVDALLSSPGIAQREQGESGDLDVARLLDDIQSTSQTVVLEVGSEPDAWSRRALATADRLVVVATPDGALDFGARLRRLLDFTPPGVPQDLLLLRADGRAPTGTAGCLDVTGCQQAHHVDMDEFRDVIRIARVLSGQGRGLVLSGGGARGFAHLGVHRALVELGIEADMFAGSSIGSPLAACMADGIPPQELEELVERLFARVLDYTVPVVSLVSGRRIAAATAQVFGDRCLEDLRRGCVCVSTDLTTARPHVHRLGSIVEVVRASCAIPGIMPPVPHHGHLLVDGGVTNNLPVDVMRDLSPCGDILAVDVVPATGPRARQDFGLWISGIRAARHRIRGRRTFPAMATTIMHALTVASAQRRNGQATAEADCHLQLDLRGVSMLDFGSVRSVAQRGYDQAMPALEKWLDSCGSNHTPGEVDDDARGVA